MTDKLSKLEELRAQLSDEGHLSKIALRIIDALVEHVDNAIERKLGTDNQRDGEHA